jgi:poly-gamma-glutamate synthesis protein (capsule biosynthesis protein)
MDVALVRRGLLAVVLAILVALGLALTRRDAEIEIVFVGDTAIRLRGPKEPANDTSNAAALADIGPALRGADFIVGNLEAPIVDGEFGPDDPPRQWPDVLPAFDGFTAFSLGNNHSMDYGGRGLRDTMRRLEDVGIRTFGAGKTREGAMAPLWLEKRGLRVAIVGGLSGSPQDHVREGRAGVFGLDDASVREALAVTREADVAVFFPHWGANWRPVGSEQRALAAAAVEAGADLIIGHHPHMAQAVESLDGVPILYSIGNFIFHGYRQSGSLAKKDWEYSLVTRVVVAREGVRRIEITPFFSNNTLQPWVPRAVADEEAAALWKRIIAVPYGTRGGTAVILLPLAPG